MTTVAQLRRREEAVNLLHLHTILHCKILQLADELAVREVGHLPTPQRGHARELQVLDADGVEASAEVVRQLPLPVVAAVGDHLLHAVLRQPCGASMIAALLLARQPAVGGTLCAEGLLQVSGRLYALTVGERHVGLQAEVDAYGCTIMCLSDRLSFGFDTEDDVVFSERRPLHGHGLYLAHSHVWTGERELIAFLGLVDGEHVAVQRVATLLEYEGLEVIGFLELGRSRLDVLEETLVRLVEPLQHLLHRLRVMAAALAEPLHPLLLHPRYVDVPTVHTVVPLLQGQRMIPHPACLAQHRVEVLGLLGRVEFILVGYHTPVSNIGQHFALLWLLAHATGRFCYPTRLLP